VTLQHIADVDSPEIGRFYLVPVVYGYWLRWLRWWPILGGWHEDMKYIGFAKHHYHVDARFVEELHPTPEHMQPPIWQEFRLPMQNWDLNENKVPFPRQPREQTLGEPVIKRRRYRRHFPDYPRTRAPWMTRLECAYKNHQLKPGLVCPHRGTPLRGLVVDSDGCVTCPLHGLRWNVSTGKLAPTNPDCVQFYAATSNLPLLPNAEGEYR